MWEIILSKKAQEDFKKIKKIGLFDKVKVLIFLSGKIGCGASRGGQLNHSTVIIRRISSERKPIAIGRRKLGKIATSYSSSITP